jgi:predicted glycoside hydrolase/deacetylase ChbG (UPF0249 family)
MANGDAFQDAIESARELPTLSVGCHVVLVDGAPVAEPNLVPTLLGNRGPAPRLFYSSISSVARRALLRRLDEDQLTIEIVAQIRKLQAAGVQVTHLDAHKHTHMFPQVLRALVHAARICGVPAIRNPFVPARSLRAQDFSGRPGLWKRYSQVRVLNSFATNFRSYVKRAGMATPDGAVGIVETGALDALLLRRILSNLPEGTWELVCHPGYEDAELRSWRTRLLQSREIERQLLTSSELREWLEDEAIRIIGYREFASN